MSKVLVVGLDALDPALVNRWLPDLPHLRQLIASGISGPLQSIIQPVTPAAWTAMLNGRNQGHFGFTDFFYRPSLGYEPPRLVHSGAIKSPTLTHYVAKADMRAIMVGVPISYPPIQTSGGICVSCFMAPSLQRGITSPTDLQAEILAVTSHPYLLDVAVDEVGYADQDALVAQLINFDKQRFDIAHHLMQTKPWELLFLTCMGTDRVGHYFMRYQDPTHRWYPGETEYADAIRQQYRYCDQRLGELIADAGPETTVLVVSDHGMQRLDGRVYLNRWLMEHGYLHLKKEPDGPLNITAAQVDWQRTKAWALGYGGQIYMNARGRQPIGCVPLERIDELCREIVEGLSQLNDSEGTPLQVTSYFGSDLFDGPYADRCPDLCLQFNNLHYLVSNRVDPGPLVVPVGSDDVDTGCHAMQGFFAMAGPKVPAYGRFQALHILDVAPTILDLLNLPLPDLEGQPVHRAGEDINPFDETDEQLLINRLQKLYLD